MPGPGPSPALDLATDLVSLLQTRETGAPPPVAQLSKLHALLAAEASTSAPSQLPFGELVARSRVCLLPLTLVLMDHALLGAPRGLQAHELAAASLALLAREGGRWFVAMQGPEAIVRLLLGLATGFAKAGELQRPAAALDEHHAAALSAVEALLSLPAAAGTAASAAVLAASPGAHHDAIAVQVDELRVRLDGAQGRGLVAQCLQAAVATARRTDLARATRLAGVRVVRAALSGGLCGSPDLWRCFFPGVFSGLFRTLRDDPVRAGAPLVAESLRALGDMTRAVCADAQHLSLLRTVPSSAAALGGSADAAVAALRALGAAPASPPPPPAPPPPPPSRDAAPAMSAEATAEWLAETRKKLELLLPAVCATCRRHAHVKVRVALVGVVAALLAECRETLSGAPCADLVDALAALRGDAASASVRDAAAAAWATTAAQGGGGGPEALRDSVGPRVLQRVRALPALARAGNDQATAASLDALSGYAHFFAGGGGGALSEPWPSVAPKGMLDALSATLEMDTEAAVAAAAAPHGEHALLRDDLPGPPERRAYRHVRADATVASAHAACRNLGAAPGLAGRLAAAYVDARQRLAPRLAPEQRRRGRRRDADGAARLECRRRRLLAALHVANLAAAAAAPSDAAALVDDLLVAHVASAAWRLPTAREGEGGAAASAASLHELQWNGHLVATQIDTATVLARAAPAATLGALPALLYPLLDKAVDPHPLVRDSAAAAVRALAEAASGGTGGVGAFLVANSDYIVDGLLLKMRHGDGADHVRASRVLGAVLRRGGAPLARTMEREVMPLATDLLDLHWANDTIFGTLCVVRAMMEAKGGEFGGGDEGGGDDDGGPFPEDDALDEADRVAVAAGVRRPWLQCLERIARYDPDPFGEYGDCDGDGDDTGDGDGDGDNGEEVGADGERPPTLEEQFVVNAVERASYYANADAPNLQLAALAIAARGLQRLQGPDRSHLLLPLVHRVWPAVVAGLQDEAARLAARERARPAPDAAVRHVMAIADAAPAEGVRVEQVGAHLDLMVTLARAAGDFMAQRFASDLWPALQALLVWAGASGHAAAARLRRHAARCMARVCAVPALAALVRSLAGEMGAACAPLLADADDDLLRAAAGRWFAAVKRVDADAVWRGGDAGPGAAPFAGLPI